MRVWRLTTRKYLDEAFTGKGAAEQGGRWNRENTAVVYTASSLALAALEFFVNLDGWVSPRLVAIPVEIPDRVRVKEIAVSELPSSWRDVKAHSAQAIGERWIREAATAVLSVPSVVVPQERNFILNPAHDDFGLIQIGEPEPFEFDRRMWK